MTASQVLRLFLQYQVLHIGNALCKDSTAKRIRSSVRREVVEFPEKDESTGELPMTFSGSAPNDYLTAKIRPLQP